MRTLLRSRPMDAPPRVQGRHAGPRGKRGCLLVHSARGRLPMVRLPPASAVRSSGGEETAMTSRERNILMGALVGFAVFGTWLFFYNRPHMDFFCQEDGFVEYSEAFLYLFAGGFFVYMGAHKRFRNLWYWGYAVLFLGVCGEEVSWGQRIYNIGTPT